MTEPIPTDRELEALKVLWEHQRATVRVVCDSMNANAGGQLAYTTVLSLLQVMEQKGLVGHQQSGKAYTYFAKVQRDRTFRRVAVDFLEKVFDGAVDQYLAHALQSRHIAPEELDTLEEMIQEAKQRSQPASKRKKRQ